MEKLVEEIRALMGAYGTTQYDAVLGLDTELTKEKIIMKAIKMCGKAYADGELELPGEVGRGEFVRNSLGLIEPSWNRPPTEPLSIKEPWHRFIGLRPEEEK